MNGYGREALIEVGRRHWREYLPEKYARLKASGELESPEGGRGENVFVAVFMIWSKNAHSDNKYFKRSSHADPKVTNNGSGHVDIRRRMSLLQ